VDWDEGATGSADPALVLAAFAADLTASGVTSDEEDVGLAEAGEVLFEPRTEADVGAAGFFRLFLGAALFLAGPADFLLDAAAGLAFLVSAGTGSGTETAGFSSGGAGGLSFTGLLWRAN
jgi:hypothetical protein